MSATTLFVEPFVELFDVALFVALFEAALFEALFEAALFEVPSESDEQAPASKNKINTTGFMVCISFQEKTEAQAWHRFARLRTRQHWCRFCRSQKLRPLKSGHRSSQPDTWRS
jgi:hypothetical protein